MMRVIRRFPTYDFILETTASTSQASAELENFLLHQKRPKGFVLSDPRVDGVVAGSTFTVHRRESGMGGSVSPYFEGYFVPADGGCDIFVRVTMPAWWWLFDLGIALLAFFSIGSGSVVQGLLMSAMIGAVAVGITIAAIWHEGSQAEALLQRLLPLRPAA